MAVGTAHGAVYLLGHATGFPIRSFSVGAPSGRTCCSCRSLCFTPDGQFIVASEEDYPQLCMCRVSDGLFVRHIGVGVLCDGDKDVEFAPNGELLVAGGSDYRVCVFSVDDDVLLRSWGTPARGETDTMLQYPSAIALAGCKLYVLDVFSHRLQVFE
jgi:hypothetical protein